MKKDKKDYKITRRIVKFILWILVMIVYRVKKVGEENIPDDEGVILCANHVHALDSVAIVLCTKKQICFMAKEELFKNPILRWLAKIFEIFPVKRGTKDIDAIKNSMKVLKAKKILGIFPEGTRNGLKKNVKPKSGAIHIAAKSGAKVVPLTVKGSFKPFTKVTLIYGKPIDYSYLNEDKQNKEALEKATFELMEIIEKPLAG